MRPPLHFSEILTLLENAALQALDGKVESGGACARRSLSQKFTARGLAEGVRLRLATQYPAMGPNREV
jgi:hypothetical protein